MINQNTLFIIGVLYLGSLFLLAYITDKGLLPKKLVHHPLVFVLSLGVFAGTWTVYGAVGFLHESGYNFLTFYFGMSLAYFLTPVLLAPIFRLSKAYQLNSLADLLVFRYRSPIIGSLITVFMIIAITPVLAAQIQAVSSSIYYITQGSSKNQLAIMFCIFMTLFTIIFGASHFDDRDQKHNGLIVAIAAESLFKLLAMLLIAGFCIYVVFDGQGSLNTWLRNNPKNVTALYQPMIHGNWPSLVLIFFTASFAMPHMYHMAFTENNRLKSLYTAAWGLPLYLFLMAICIPPVLWAGKKLLGDVNLSFDYLAITVALSSEYPYIAILAYLAGLSAASGVIIISTLALASMSLNHIVMPLTNTPTTGIYLYSWLRWQKYFLIASIISLAYIVFYFIDKQQTLSQLILLAYTASVQFLPSVFGVLFWKRANRYGVLSGMIAGFGIWLLAFYLPLLIQIDPLGFFNLIGIKLTYVGIQLNNRDWHFITMSSILINFLIMFVVSLITTTSEEENLAAEQCSQDLFSRQKYRQLAIDNAYEFKIRLSKALGEKVAEREVFQAMKELQLSWNESRPFVLQQLRHRIETNLSRLLGTSRAQEIIRENIPYAGSTVEAEDLYVMEGRLEEYQYRLTGLAAELNHLRKFHRQTLQNLPIGVCALAEDQEIVTWNKTLQEITGISDTYVIGASLEQLPSPWNLLFKEFSLTSDTRWHRKKLTLNGETCWFNLHKAEISDRDTQEHGGMAILIEDMTNLLKLEAKLTHSERLASIGRMAAGVAHEIGNPITAIDCLAQNLLYDLNHQTDTKDKNIYTEEEKKTLEEIRGQTKRIATIVQSLMNFSHAGKSDRESLPVNIYNCVEEAIKLLLIANKHLNVTLENLCPQSHYVQGDEQLLIQAFINLISNAIDASDINKPAQKNKILITSKQVDSQLLISVIDHGHGIPEGLLATIFEPFVTSKDPGKGTGLGLALVHSIIEDHGGSITIENWKQTDKQSHSTLSGTQVNVKLPIYKPA